VYACLNNSSPYIDFQERSDIIAGRGYWIELCLGLVTREDPSLLQMFVDKGVNVRETDEYGFNCLFAFVSRAKNPGIAREVRALQYLLSIFDDIYALDATGHDIFAYTNELRDWPGSYREPYYECGSYRQDLWYCALARSKLRDRHNIQSCNRLARYTRYYTPKHYLALCHLDDWDLRGESLFTEQIQISPQECLLSEDEERIQQEMESLWG
jgi:hypothetical protein